MENWSTVFTPNPLTWLLPFGTPSVLQALDYQAEVPAGGLVSERPQESEIVAAGSPRQQ